VGGAGTDIVVFHHEPSDDFAIRADGGNEKIRS
jgi:hypothetical protein